jgi:hypothetical protein
MNNYEKTSLMLHLFRCEMFSVVRYFQGVENIFQRLGRTENHRYFLYFHSIILTYKNQFLFTI